MGLALCALAAPAVADSDVTQPGEGAGQTLHPRGLAVDTETGQLYVADAGNRRIDVFAADGHFEMAFGWGVVDGQAEPQTCTTVCRKGLAGGGAGEFSDPGSLAVDNDPASPSNHDVYVDDGEGDRQTSARIQKFSPDGQFLLAFGAGVISGGASATGDVTAGSATVTNVVVTSRSFEPGQLLTGPGIAAGTRIIGLGDGTITLSKPATGPGTQIALTVPAGPGNQPVNEVQRLTNEGLPDSTFGVRFRTPDPTPTDFESATRIPVSSPAAAVRELLEQLPNVGIGNVAVTGPTGGPFTVEFKGSRFSDTDVERMGTPGGAFDIATIRNGHSGAQVCTAAIAESCAGGTKGRGPGEFSEQVRISVGSDGTVFVADSNPTTERANPDFEDRVQKFTPSGTLIEELPLPQLDTAIDGLAVAPAGDFYLASDGKVWRFDAAGSLLESFPAESETAIGTDGAGDLFTIHTEREQTDRAITERSPGGQTVRRFGYDLAGPRPLAVAPFSSSRGDVYVAHGDLVRYLTFPPPGPLSAPEPCSAEAGNVQATLKARVNPEGNPTTTHFEYVDQASFEAQGGFAGPDTLVTPESASIGDDFVLHGAGATVDVLPQTVYHCRVIATDSNGVSITGQEGTFETKPAFEIAATWASRVGGESAQLNAAVEPLGIHAEGFFEYVEQAEFERSGFAGAQRAPVATDLDFGAALTGAAVRDVSIAGLREATRYRYRVVVRDSFFPAGVPGPTRSFRTRRQGADTPDARAYELVSPIDKDSADLGVPGNAGGLFESGGERNRITAAAPGGDAVTYTSFISFGEDAASAPGASQYISRRTPDGWTTSNVNLPGTRDPLRPPYLGFTPDLGFGAVALNEPAITADAVSGFQNLYLRDEVTGALRAVTTDVPQLSALNSFCTGFAGATPDGQHAIFAANGALAGAPTGNGFSLYEWTAGEGVKLVSVLPNGTSVAPTGDNGFGARGGGCEPGHKIVRHAISEDGQRVFWTWAFGTNEGESELLVRLGGNETIQLDQTVGAAAGPPGGGRFWSASPDGSKVLFSDQGRLVADAGRGDLYRYDVAARSLTDLTPGPEPADVLGVLGSSEDVSSVYFAANGVLAPGATPGDCNGSGSSGSGSCNLYRYHDGDGVTFIGRLDGIDNSDWSTEPLEQTARVTPDGRNLVFSSVNAEGLTGYDNAIDAAAPECQVGLERKLQGDPRCAEAFLYEATANAGQGSLRCVSCNPTGGRPSGPVLLARWSNAYEQPHYLSDDGSRVFFETLDGLLSTDANERFDVYEFERVGSGSCTADSPGFSEEAAGCLYLVSTGRSEEDSYFLDASSDGRDVFFSTGDPILPGRDRDEHYDVYDFRSGGGFPEPVEAEPCDGEGCRPPTQSPPAPTPPATATAPSLGNVVAPRKPHGHHRKGRRSRHHKGSVHKRGARR